MINNWRAIIECEVKGLSLACWPRVCSRKSPHWTSWKSTTFTMMGCKANWITRIPNTVTNIILTGTVAIQIINQENNHQYSTMVPETEGLVQRTTLQQSFRWPKHCLRLWKNDIFEWRKSTTELGLKSFGEKSVLWMTYSPLDYGYKLQNRTVHSILNADFPLS
jgi:hypothetical protein